MREGERSSEGRSPLLRSSEPSPEIESQGIVLQRAKEKEGREIGSKEWTTIVRRSADWLARKVAN